MPSTFGGSGQSLGGAASMSSTFGGSGQSLGGAASMSSTFGGSYSLEATIRLLDY